MFALVAFPRKAIHRFRPPKPKDPFSRASRWDRAIEKAARNPWDHPHRGPRAPRARCGCVTFGITNALEFPPPISIKPTRRHTPFRHAPEGAQSDHDPSRDAEVDGTAMDRRYRHP